MVRVMVAALAVVLGGAPVAHAATSLLLPRIGDGAVVTVGEGCGPGRWRGPYGGCHWFRSPCGSYRGTPAECPPAFFFAPNYGRCFPVC